MESVKSIEAQEFVTVELLYQKINALQAALSLTLSCVSTVMPLVKEDVIRNLEQFLQQQHDPVVIQAYAKLIEEIKSLEVIPVSHS